MKSCRSRDEELKKGVGDLGYWDSAKGLSPSYVDISVPRKQSLVGRDEMDDLLNAIDFLVRW